MSGKIFVGVLFCCLVLAEGKPAQGPVVRSKRANERFSWHDCGSDPNRPLRVTGLDISPSPLTMPGPMTVRFSAEVTRNIGRSSDVVLDIKTERKILWSRRNITVPCIRNIGSCTLTDSCTLVNRMVTENWLGISATVGRQIRQGFIDNNLKTTCPVEAGNIDIPSMTFQMPSIPRILSFFAGGTYYGKMRFLNPANHNEEYGCIAVKLFMN